MTSERANTALMARDGDGPIGPTLPKAPTGIVGLDAITGGGLPQGRTTLVTGPAGSGKTLLALQFLVAGAREHGEPGVLITFEESVEKVTANVASLGFDLEGLQRDGLLIIHSFRVDPSDLVATGDFDLEPILLLIDEAIERIGAKRVVLDTLEVLLGGFANASLVRGELSRLLRLLDERNLSAIVTGEKGPEGLSRHGIEEFVTDCVIVLDHRIHDEVSTRLLRVVKYRGSVHGTNEYPFLITARGFVVLPITSISLDYGASNERISTGVARLDHMIAGGVFRGSTVLVSGTAGTGKTTLGAHFVDAACARGERALMILFEESPEQQIRNMGSVGIDLRQWVDAGLLRIFSARPTAFGLESHLSTIIGLLDEVAPAIVVLDGMGAFTRGPAGTEITSMIARLIDVLKGRGITGLATSTAAEDEPSAVGVSSLIDTWLLLRVVESDGERNRLLFVVKSRGTAHSNQAREFVVTDHGIDLIDVSVGDSGGLTGSARINQETQARARASALAQDRALHRREAQRDLLDGEARLLALQDELAAKRSEIAELAEFEGRRGTEAEASRQAMATQRWSDPPQPEEAAK